MTANRVWFVVDVKFIASVSFGKDSLAMLLRLMAENRPLDTVLFYDTGMEFEAIYRVRDRIKPYLELYGIEFVELHPETPFLYSMFEKQIRDRNGSGYHVGYGWCGGVCRWGTSEKRQAIQRYKRSLGEPVTDYIGIAADETERFEKDHSTGTVMPLVEWGMTEANCLSWCRDRGWNWIEQTRNGPIDLYLLLDRVSCWCCRNKNLRELKAIHFGLPEYWDRLKDLQSRLPEPMKGEGKSVFDLEYRFELERQWQLEGKKTNTRAFKEALHGREWENA